MSSQTPHHIRYCSSHIKPNVTVANTRREHSLSQPAPNFQNKQSKETSLYICNFVIIIVIVATTTRQQPSDAGATADWATSSSTTILAGPDDLSLGFNANAAALAAVAPSGSTNAQWQPSSRPLNYGFPPDMGMVGLRDFVLVTPASFNHHHRHHHTQDSIMANDQINGPNDPRALGVGVIPLLTTAPCLAPHHAEDTDLLNNNDRSKFTGMQLWQNPNSSHYLKKSSSNPNNHNSSSMNLIQSSGGIGGTGSGSGCSGSSSGATCQDCGNQAKKDCRYRRCRTCCKSRSFDCPTHVKSTWVPAARRRDRQLMTVGATAAGAGLSGSTAAPKKPRLRTSQTTTASHTSTSNATTPPRSLDTCSSPQNAEFKEPLPAQVRATAVFKCVKVTAIEEGEDEFAYEAVVKIGGHVFKGLLYDQGVDGFPNISQLHLSGRNGESSSSPVLDASQVYEATTGGGLLRGSNYGSARN
ncbi:protein LATERAL ROOT PRIMORDIUM 1-like [Gossypium australe]|uniref:Protein LATERAL ROOT PRIMORDIUM 1-like n=1 Tax=Gossypium australe TaxID=47621 RepID=A0A5B6X961_9ROSI|nr:protein LATERAL ROOT PRIMORDIUM 1-like [Gossypium australe]